MATGSGRSFGANILISFAFTGLMTVLSFSNSVVVARMVGAEGRGLYALAVAVLGIGLPLATLGLSFSSTWALGRGKSWAEVASLNHVWAGLLLLPAGLVVGATLWWYGGVPEAEWALVAIVCAGTLPSAVYMDTTRHAFLGLNQVFRYNSVQLSTVTGLLIFNVCLLGWGPKAVLLTLALAHWLPTLILLALHLPHVTRAVWPSRAFVDESVTYGVKATTSQVIEVLLLKLDYLLVTPIVGMAAIGLFSVADQIATVLAWGGIIAGRMMLAQSASDPGGEQSRRKLGLAVRTLLLAVSIGAVFLALIGWWAIPFVFGAEFSPVYPGLLLMLPAALVRGSTSLVAGHLIGRNVIRPVLIAGSASVVGIIVLSPLAALAFGWLGVAAVRVVVLFVQLVLIVRANTRESGEPLRWIFNGEDYRSLKAWVQVRLARQSGGAPPAE